MNTQVLWEGLYSSYVITDTLSMPAEYIHSGAMPKACFKGVSYTIELTESWVWRI